MAEVNKQSNKRCRHETGEAANAKSSEPAQQLSVQHEKPKDEPVVHVVDLAESEAQDLQDLQLIAAEATVLEFDSACGRPIRHSFLPPDSLDPIDGIVKMSLPRDLLSDLARIHDHIKQRVRLNEMVPWAGVGGDTTRLRAFGFLGQSALDRLDASTVRLHAPEKTGIDAEEDEKANRRAICVLDTDNDDADLNATRVAKDVCAAIMPNRAGLDPTIVRAEELIAYQTNLHNGAQHLAAHLDCPLHEGFGKVIVTVAIRGSATILLISGDTVGEGENEVQPAWRFHLNEGEAYALSGNARNTALHAVLADNADGTRESLNLRFGVHTDEEAEEQVTRFWPDEL